MKKYNYQLYNLGSNCWKQLIFRELFISPISGTGLRLRNGIIWLISIRQSYGHWRAACIYKKYRKGFTLTRKLGCQGLWPILEIIDRVILPRIGRFSNKASKRELIIVVLRRCTCVCVLLIRECIILHIIKIYVEMLFNFWDYQQCNIEQLLYTVVPSSCWNLVYMYMYSLYSNGRQTCHR